MTFRETVEAAQSPVSDACREGKQALESRHRAHVTCWDSRRLTGSVDLDQPLAQEPGCASAPRWDCGFGYAPKRGAERAVWVEFHSATAR